MRTLPPTDPGTPDLRSPARFLAWLARRQAGLLAAGAGYATLWMGGQALAPALLGRAIDDGVAARDVSALLGWAGALLGAGVLSATAAVFGHRVAVASWLDAMYRVQQLVVRTSARLGGTLPRRVPTGEIVAVSSSDAPVFGGLMEVLSRAAGALVAFAVVAAFLLGTSPTLGLLVLVGVPLLMLAVGPLLRPLHRRQTQQRELVSRLTTLGSDTVTGLRVLRGVGGEEAFLARYHAYSQDVRSSGVRVARVQSVVDATQVLLPGIFLVLVSWLGARLAVAGQISVGELVAFYGYAAFLVTPLRTATEAVDKLTRSLVAAKRACTVLSVAPQLREPATPHPEPATPADLVDLDSGLVVTPGRLTAVVAAEPDSASRLADRLGRYVDADVGLGGVPLRRLPTATVRRRVLVSDKDPRLFAGRLREELDVTGHAGADTVLAAVHAASGQDILDGLPEGLDTVVQERGRSFSGGQRQRLVLARALVADPEILVLDEPTSAVDAHTEARIAARLRDARRGRTTLVMTSSPLVLDHTDSVSFLVDGRVVAEGTHRQLMHADPAYRRVVTRGEQP